MAAPPRIDGARAWAEDADVGAVGRKRWQAAMDPIPMMLWCLSFAAVVFAWALIAGRRGQSVHHARAFYSGLVGLLAIPTLLVAIAAMALQLFWATFLSPAGLLLVICSLALLVSLGFSIVSLVTLGSRRVRV